MKATSSLQLHGITTGAGSLCKQKQQRPPLEPKRRNAGWVAWQPLLHFIGALELSPFSATHASFQFGSRLEYCPAFISLPAA